MSKERDLPVPRNELENAFRAEHPSDIRNLTRMLGSTVERVVLNTGLVKEAGGLNLKKLRTGVEIVKNSLDAKIGSRRLRGSDLNTVFQLVMAENRPQIVTIFKAADTICNTCRVSGLAPSFQEALEGSERPGHGHLRYWLEAALMMAKEVTGKPLLQLPHDWVYLMGETAVGKGTAKFDGLIVPFGDWGGERPSFAAIQKRELPWWTIEIKAIFSWWRNVGKSPLEKPPKDIMRQVDERLGRAALWADNNTGGYFPPIGEILLLFRGWRESLSYVKPWHMEEWQLARRKDRLDEMFWYE